MGRYKGYDVLTSKYISPALDPEYGGEKALVTSSPAKIVKSRPFFK